MEYLHSELKSIFTGGVSPYSLVKIKIEDMLKVNRGKLFAYGNRYYVINHKKPKSKRLRFLLGDVLLSQGQGPNY
ncbi:hypothetical protein ACQVVN_29885, partial [Bacillus pseudomycoides]